MAKTAQQQRDADSKKRYRKRKAQQNKLNAELIAKGYKPHLLQTILDELKHCNAKAQTAIIRIANLQVEVQELRKENQTVLNALRATLEIPREDGNVAKALIKDTQKNVSHAYDKPR